LGWEAVAGGGDYADGGEAGGADRTLGNTDNFSLGFLVNNLKALLLKPIATAVNWLAISPSVTGSGVTLEAEGTDTNIDINLLPKGTGNVVLSDGTYSNLIKTSQAEGIAAGDMRVGLDESFRQLNVMDAGDIDVNLFGNSAKTEPSVVIWQASAASGNKSTLDYKSLSLDVSNIVIDGNDKTFTVAAPLQFISKTDVSAGDVFSFKTKTGAFVDDGEATDTNGEQSWLYLNPRIRQSGTAAYNGIKVDATENTLGDGSTGDGNNLLNLAVGGVSKARIDNTGAIFSSGTPAYADEAAAVTAGLATGDIYQTTGTAASPLNVAGILMIKQ